MTRAVLLTFDDGPDPTWTPQVLERLAAGGATATFFVLGERVREHPELIDAIRAGGHVIGLHGDAHLDHSKAAADALEIDTARALDTLREVGIRPKLWRLPWGRMGETTPSLARAHRLTVIGWDADTHDWRGDGWDDQPPSVRRVPETGGVVLLHDAIGPGQTRTGCINTLELVDALIDGARTQGSPVSALR